MKHFFLLSAIAILSLLFSCQSTVPSRAKGQLIEKKLTWQGMERNYLVYLPPGFQDKGAMPVLFNIHGGGGTARGCIGLTFGRFNELADEHGFMVVYPNAIQKNWADGRKEHLKPIHKDVDDVGFISEIVSELKANYSIDNNRIYTSGMSNGGFMSSRLLCDRADIFRGGAVLTATISSDYIKSCNPSRPVAVIVMNGTDDKLIPYDGGQVRVLGQNRGSVVSTDAYIEFWQKKNGCTSQNPVKHFPNTNKEDGTTVSLFSYGNCSPGGALALYRIEGGGHTWPGGKQYLGEKLIGKTSRELNACEVIWDFFDGL